MGKRIFVIANIGFIIGIVWGLYFKMNIIPFLSIFVGFAGTIFFLKNTIIKRIAFSKWKKEGSKKVITNNLSCFKQKRNRLSFDGVDVKDKSIKKKITICYRIMKYLKVCIAPKTLTIFVLFMIIGMLCITLKINKFETFLKDMQKNSNTQSNVTAIIVSDKEEKEYSDVYKAKIISVDNKKYNNTYCILKIKKQNGKRLEYGDFIYLVGEFNEPKDRTNYKGYSYKEYLRTINIYGTFKCRYNDVKILEKDKNDVFKTIANMTKNSINQKIDKLYKSEEEKALLKGILLGIKDELTEEQKENFKVSSLSHILAVSGMHITYVITGVIFLFAAFGIRKQTVYILTIIVIIFFMFLTEFTPSVVRAGIMAILVLLAFLVKRKSDVWINISLASLVILMANPYAILSLSYQLSFLGTIGIILGTKVISKFKKAPYKKHYIALSHDTKAISKIKKKVFHIKKFFISTALVCISAQLFVSPIILMNFNTISIYFLLSNILIAPIIGIVIILGFLIVIVSFIFYPLAELLNIFEFFLLKSINIMTNFITNLPNSCIYCKTPYIISIVIYFSLILFLTFCYLIKNRTIRMKIHKNYKRIIKFLKIILVTYLVILLLIDFNLFGFNNFKLYFIDVGQGDSSLIVTNKNKKILVDGGGNENYDVGKNTTLPYLLDRRITTLDYVIISHFDSDHVQGLFAVLNNIKVKNVIISEQIKVSSNYEKFLEIVKNKKIKIIVVNAGDKINVENGTYIHVLWPIKGEYLKENPLNNNSIVFKIVYKNFKILFTGDIEEKAENMILSKKIDVKADILKVAHHRF